MDSLLTATLQAELASRIAALEAKIKEQAMQYLALDTQHQQALGQLEEARKDARRWNAMRELLVAVDWAWNIPPLSVAIFECKAETVFSGPEGADAIADSAIKAADGGGK